MKTLTTDSLLIVMIMAIVGCVTPTVVLQETKPVQAAPSTAESVTARVDQLFAQWDRSDSPGCILGVSQNGVVVYERGYGMANLDYGLPITPASVFDVASIDKQFTAMAILILEQRGQLSVDDDVRKYLSELPEYWSRVTLRHLLTHTSGVRDSYRLMILAWGLPEYPSHGWQWAGTQFTRKDRLRMLARQSALQFTPGTDWSYGDTGYHLLDEIVERVSGQSLRAFADTNIFTPLGMLQTHMKEERTSIVRHRTSGYYIGSGSAAEVDLQDLQAIAHWGDLNTTARDMLIWEQNFADPRATDRALVAATKIMAAQTPTTFPGGFTTKYNYGLQEIQVDGVRGIGHGGGNDGVSANVARYPDQGLSIAVLCNLRDINSGKLSQGVASIYLAKTLPTPTAASTATAAAPTVSLSAEQLASMVGLYRESQGALRRVFVRDGKLMWNLGAFISDRARELTPLSATRFLSPFSGLPIEFVPAEAGRPAEIHVITEDKIWVNRQVKEFAPSSTELRTFAGVYVSPELEVTYTVDVRDSGLMLQHPRGTGLLVRPTFTDAFHSDHSAVRFTRDARGVPTGFTLDGGLRFDRVK